MAIPTLAMIPSGYKAGKLYSVLPSDGTGDFTVARNSVATRVNQSGLIEEVGVNVPRLDYSAGGCPVLLTEIQSQNILPYSEDFSQWDNNGAVITPSQSISPSGILNASLVTISSAGNRFADVISTAGGTFTFSFYIKAKEGESGVWSSRVIGDSTITTNTEVNDSYWTRVTQTFTKTGSGNVVVYPIYAIATTTTLLNAYIWGAQVEAQPAATSYIKSNSGSATTREADLVNGAGSAATFNSLEHTFFVDLNSVFENAAFSSISIVGSTGNVTDNIITIVKRPSDSEVTLQTTSGGSAVATETLSNIDFSVKQKLAITVKLNEVKYYLNGFLVATDTGTIPLPVSLGEITLTSGTTGFPFFASTKDIRYYNQVLTAAETLELMSYDSFNEMASALQYTIK